MNITKENYEYWAFRYLEGELSASETEQMISFLVEHPEINEELDRIRTLPNNSMEIVPQNFSYLKKSFESIEITDTTFEEFCIAHFERDLSWEKSEQLFEFIGNKNRHKSIFDTYSFLKLQPDERITFEDKQLLTKPVEISGSYKRFPVFYFSAIAASILVLILFVIGLKDTPKVHNKPEVVSQISEPETIADQDISETSSIGTITQTIDKPENTMPVEVLRPFENPVVDTSRDIHVLIPTARIEVAVLVNPSSPNEYELKRSTFDYYQHEQSFTEQALTSIRASGNSIISGGRSLSFDHLLRKGVEGINQLAEAELSYNSETDEKGRITAFALSSERIHIKRIIKNN